jgi:hypothetical protein
MMSQARTNETKTDVVEPAVSENPSSAQADTVGLGCAEQQSAGVEEIRTDETPTAKTQPKNVSRRIRRSQSSCSTPMSSINAPSHHTRVGDQRFVYNHKDDPIVKSFPLVEVPLPEQIACVMEKLLEIWPDGKVSATMVLLPREGEAERKMVVSIRAGSDTPIVLSGSASEFPLPPPITVLLDELKEPLPSRHEEDRKEAKERSKTNTKTAGKDAFLRRSLLPSDERWKDADVSLGEVMRPNISFD